MDYSIADCLVHCREVMEKYELNSFRVGVLTKLTTR